MNKLPLVVAVLGSVWTTTATCQTRPPIDEYTIYPHHLQVQELDRGLKLKKSVFHQVVHGHLTVQYEERKKEDELSQRVSVRFIPYQDKEEVAALTKRLGEKLTSTKTEGRGVDAVETYQEMYEQESAVIHLVVVTPGGKNIKNNTVLKSLKLTLLFPPAKSPSKGVVEIAASSKNKP